MDTLHEDQFKFLITSRSIPPGIENTPDKIVEKIKTQILCSHFFPPENVPFMR
jgi:hypothetical protein